MFHTQPLLLIAEDDPDDQFMILDAFKEVCPVGLNIRFVRDGVELIEYLQSHESEANPPKLVMLDLNMPRKDGRTALQEIKADPALCAIPIAVLTTSSRVEDAEFCSCQGIVGYYCKPSSYTGLHTILCELYSRYLEI